MSAVSHGAGPPAAPLISPDPPGIRKAAPGSWELAAEAIAVKIRWFGLLVGYAVVNLGDNDAGRRFVLNALLTLGAVYTVLDTGFSLRGRVFLGRFPLVISAMEALFIALLCYHDSGLESPFRYYYFLSLICCSVRHSSPVTYATCALHCVSYGVLYLALPADRQLAGPAALTLVMLGWVTWASNALTLLLKRVGEYLGRLNDALVRHQTELEARIAERTRQLQEAQAHVLHQEKMAAFGLLAAGIAHEVGNPLTSISSMVQMLQRREADPYTLNKLALVSGQLKRIRTTLRELVEFSRPARGGAGSGRVSLAEILEEALSIAKYYKRTGGRIAAPDLPHDLPPLVGVRDQLVQVFLNLVLNAIDATDRDGKVELAVLPFKRGPFKMGNGEWGMGNEDGDRADAPRAPVPGCPPGFVEVLVRDGGCGIPAGQAGRVFQPYFTTKKDGTGLGLFVTRRLVNDHGGEVFFESEPGRGTTFHVRLPLAPYEERSFVPENDPGVEEAVW